MDQIYPDDGLETILTSVVAGGIDIHLFVNDLVPTLDSVLFDFTEAAWSGYVPITVPAVDFIFQAIAAHVAQLTAAPIFFTNTSGVDQQVYGYYATTPGGGNVLWAARFDGAPLPLPFLGSLPVTPGLANYSALAV